MIRSVKLRMHVSPSYPSLPVFCPFTLVIPHVRSTRSCKQSSRERGRYDKWNGNAPTADEETSSENVREDSPDEKKIYYPLESGSIVSRSVSEKSVLLGVFVPLDFRLA